MTEAQIAGTLPLRRVMAALSKRRRVFHSEADFQFSFAQVAKDLDPSIGMHLEVRQPGDVRESVDLVCRGQRTTFLEFKYFTSQWHGVDPISGEEFSLRNHAATDLARLNFIHDVRRLERFVDAGRTDDGIAVLLSNAASLWSSPSSRATNDRAFRIHEGAQLTGSLLWANDPQSRYSHHLRGAYSAVWSDYAPPLPGKHGLFRWLALPVGTPRLG